MSILLPSSDLGSRLLTRSTSRRARRLASTCTAAAALALAACAPGADSSTTVVVPDLGTPLRADAACFEAVATALSTDDLEGRGVGTAGLETAARYIERWFEDAGLEPVDGSWRQEFDVVVGVERGDGNELAARHDGTEHALEVGTDFVPLGFTSTGAFEGPLVFAGFGIRADDPAYDDYAGIDARGKVVLAMRFEPGEDDDESPFDGRRPTRWSDLRYKAFVAREAGAAALILVDPPREQDDETSRTRLPALRAMGPVSRAGLPVVQVTMDVADAWLAPAGKTLADLAAEIASDWSPRSLDLPGTAVRGTVDVEPVTARVANVLGRLPGSGPLADEHVVIGAHYDHLGHGGRGSMRPGETAIHNGADDNASGVAALLCAAGELASRGGDGRGVLAIAFTAEELGLGGSGWYVDNPRVPLESTAAMINLDMVGRVRENTLRALGTDSAPGWEALVAEAAASAELTVTPGGDGYGPSDQTSFYERRVPVVHLFSGAHDEYHTPDDDAQLLNVEGGGRVARLVADLTTALAARPERLAWAPPAEAPSMNTDSRGYGAYLGTIPDYTAMTAPDGSGVLLSGVRPGGPADRGGVKAGDTLVELAGIEIENLYDMTFALREHRPGETVGLVVLRDGGRVELSATLGKRGE